VIYPDHATIVPNVMIAPKPSTRARWLYLATVIDLASRKVVGWATADHLRTDLVDAALTDALRRRRPTGSGTAS
jgi:transposase InsO family protein